MKFITKLILVISCILIGCADPNIGQITSPSTKKTAPSIETTNQQSNVDVESYHTSTITRDEPAQLTLDNSATEVTQYLQALQKIPSDYRIQHQEQYQTTGKRLLQQIEALKKAQKRSYRIADRNFLHQLRRNKPLASGDEESRWAVKSLKRLEKMPLTKFSF